MRLVQQRSLLIFVVMVFALLVVERWIAASVYMAQSADALAFAVTVDLTIGIPALYYLFIVRVRRAPLITLAPIFLLSLLVARLVLPAPNHFYLNQMEKAVPFVELAALLFVASRVRTIARYYAQARQETPYVLDALETSMKGALGNSPAITVAVTELSLLYYATAGWFKPSPASSTGFSYHRKSGYAVILAFLVFMLALETVALHLVVQIWSDLAAWVLTILSLYTFLWLVADFHAIQLQPFRLTDEVLHLRVGLRWCVTVPLALISEIRPVMAADLKGDDYLNLAVFGEPRLLLRLQEPVVVQGPLGIHKAASRIGLTVDEEGLFKEALNRYIVPSA